MSFTWSVFSPFHLVLDGLIVVTFGVFFFFLRRWEGWISLLAGCCAAAALWAVIGLQTLGVFFVARVLWTVSTVALPLGMLYLWLRTRRFQWALGVLLILSFKLYGEAIEPRRLEVTKLTFPSAKIHTPLRITHISDIQTDGLNGMFRQAREASNAFDPHFVFFTGDLVNHPSLLPEVENYLKEFKYREGAFLVGGNIDAGLDLDEVAKHTGFQNIEGRTARRTIDGDSVVVMGLGIRAAGQKSSIHGMGPGDMVFLLSHFPDAVFTVQGEPVDLMFSGHTHGGQVCLPWLGPIETLSRVPRSVAAGGLHKVGTVWTLVNRGLGWEGLTAPRLRLFCRPQVILLDIVPTPR
jgi:uncharacterized protein